MVIERKEYIMSFITADYSNLKGNNGSYAPLPQGEYEMVIKSAHEDATPSGAETFQIDFVVRNDLNGVPALSETNGKYHDRHVFMDNWKRKATNQYDLKNFPYLLKAVGVPEGLELNSLDEVIEVIEGKPVKVFVKKETNTYNGNTTERNTVALWNISKSNFPQCQHQWQNKPKQATEPIEVPVPGLPF